MAAVSSLRAFLSTSRLALRSAIAQKQRINIVIGNESADLDSITSSIVYAYLRTCASSRSSVHYVPVINIPLEDVHIRPELLELLPHANLEPSHLITLDDLPATNSPYKLLPSETQWILVDHNSLMGDLGDLYRDRVVGCIDHHKDEGTVPQANNAEEPRIIETAGSCTSLVINHFRDAWRALSSNASQSNTAQGQGDFAVGNDDAAVRRTWDAQIAKFAITSILIDTRSLTDVNKTTRHDLEAVEFLESMIRLAPQVGVSFDREQLFQDISDAKNNLDSLDLDEILRKDYKQWSDGHVLGMSTVVKPLSYLIGRTEDGDLKSALLKFAEKRRLSLLVLMTTSTSKSGDFQRELLMLKVKPDVGDFLQRFESKTSDELKLSSWSEEDLGDLADDFKIWWQKDVSKSRKQVAPLLRDLMAEKT